MLIQQLHFLYDNFSLSTVINNYIFKLSNTYIPNGFKLKGQKPDVLFSSDRLDTVEVTLTLLINSTINIFVFFIRTILCFILHTVMKEYLTKDYGGSTKDRRQ